MSEMDGFFLLLFRIALNAFTTGPWRAQAFLMKIPKTLSNPGAFQAANLYEASWSDSMVTSTRLLPRFCLGKVGTDLFR
jgi:hypothetical protein